jgi:hypothetical protein
MDGELGHQRHVYVFLMRRRTVLSACLLMVWASALAYVVRAQVIAGSSSLSFPLQAPDGFGSAYTFTNGGSAGLSHSSGTYLVGKDGSGTDQNGELTTIATGKGTGAGSGGQFNLTVYEPSTSGSTLQTGQNALQVSGTSGAIVMGNLQVRSAAGPSIFTGASIVTGVTDVAGASATFRGGAGTGAGNGGDTILAVAPAFTTGSTPNTWQNAVAALGSTGAVNIGAVQAQTGGTSTWQGASSLASNAAGGPVIVKGGSATNGNANGGDVTLTGGTPVGSGIAGQILITGRTFANLGTPSNGAFAYCSDCTIANPCASGGSGALAKRLNATWVCN